MSSYELLELLEFMPERGAFKTTARGGEYSEEQQIWAQIANELLILRAAHVPKVKGEDYDSRIRYSPARIRELIDEAEAQAEVREDFYSFASRPSLSKADDDDFDDVEGGD